jgi:creatinine amidohydrolase
MSAYRMSDPDFWKALSKSKIAIIPVGSMEQHGPHLPVSTDALIAEHVASLVAKKVGALVLPAVAYGVSFEHAPMVNISLKNLTLASVIRDMCASLAGHGVKQVIILNGHHGNIGALRRIRGVKGASVHVIHYWRHMGQELGHAGDAETSLILAIAPKLVDMKKAVPSARKPTKQEYAKIAYLPGAFVRVTGNGVWGDPRKASAKKGQKLLKEIAASLATTISELAS